MYLLSWLRRLTSLTRLTWWSALFVFLFLFVGVPMIGPALEQSAVLLFGDDAVSSALYFLAITAATGVFATAIVGETRLFHDDNQQGYMLPAPTKRLVMLASDGMLPVELCQELLATTDRYAFFDKVKRSKLGRGGWVWLVLRAMEHHRPALLQLVFIVSNDGLGADGREAERETLDQLLRHYADLPVPGHELAFHHVEVGFRHITFGVGFEETRQVVDALQDGIDPQDVIFDFTPGTKPMSTGMVMGCLDERYDLQYFMPLPGREAREDAIRHARDHLERMRVGARIAPLDPRTVGWGLLDIEKAGGCELEDGGVMPLRIQTDPRPVIHKVEA